MKSALIGWWNTSLSPPARGVPATTSSRWALACEVFHKILVEPRPLDVLALGEITEGEVIRLLQHVGELQRFGRIIDSVRNVAILYDTARVMAGERFDITATAYGSLFNAGLWQAVEVDGLPFVLAAVHWPSRKIAGGEAHRLACGAAVQAYFRQARAGNQGLPVVVLGDFNDEPFDDSLTVQLQGTRDRSKASRNADLLYNPFWRMLGESHPLGAEGLDTFAGSCFFSQNLANDWYTFDQVLVSSSLVRGSGWTLVEEDTAIVGLECLRTESRRFRLKFDHLPILVRLEYRNVSAQPPEEEEMTL
jgi:hypothetical protein